MPTPANVSEKSENENVVLGKERLYTAVVLLTIAVFTCADLVEDHFDGAPWSHVLMEAVVVVIATILAVVLFRRSRAPFIARTKSLERELIHARADAKKWQAETSQIIRGLSTAISSQLELWGLSEAEKEIALLLLKGLSHKEIATVRNTTEQTVRQQATSIYGKSGLSGRTELSAFFLEDLLVLPTGENSNQQAH